MKNDFPCAARFLPNGTAKGTAVFAIFRILLDANVCGEHAIVRKWLDGKVSDHHVDVGRKGRKRIAGVIAVGCA